MIDAIPHLQKILKSSKRTNFLCGGQEKNPTAKRQASTRQSLQALDYDSAKHYRRGRNKKPQPLSKLGL